MTDMLATLLDERAIEAQLKNYCRAMDRCDNELGVAVFHDDAQLDYGEMFRGAPRDFVEHTIAAHFSLETHLHRISNISIAVNGDRAGSETYVDAIFRGSAQGAAFEIRTCGRYIDQWEKRGGRWAVSRRQYLHAIDSQRPAGEARFPVTGARDTTDFSYTALRP